MSIEGVFTSKLVEDSKYLNSKSYNELSPKMKLAVQDTFKLIENSTENVIESFENSVAKVSEIRDVNKQELMNYFEKETDELLGE
jgi:hypothetical protein|tara:strand:- start:2204 stop:2458 length:255 start_codon:yes stop_codon:yes gene_type:complete